MSEVILTSKNPRHPDSFNSTALRQIERQCTTGQSRQTMVGLSGSNSKLSTLMFYQSGSLFLRILQPHETNPELLIQYNPSTRITIRKLDLIVITVLP